MTLTDAAVLGAVAGATWFLTDKLLDLVERTALPTVRSWLRSGRREVRWMVHRRRDRNAAKRAKRHEATFAGSGFRPTRVIWLDAAQSPIRRPGWHAEGERSDGSGRIVAMADTESDAVSLLHERAEEERA